MCESVGSSDDALQEPLEDVEGEHRRDGDEKADRRGDERLRDSRHYRLRARLARSRQIGEGADDPEHRAEEAHEGSVVAERAEDEETLLVGKAALLDDRG